MKKYSCGAVILPAIIFLATACNSDPAKSIKTVETTIERIDPSLDAIVTAGVKAEIIADSLDWSEGPVWIQDQQMLLFSDIPPNKIYKWTPGGGKELYLTPSGYTDTAKRGGEVGSNALLIHDGKLVMCQHGDRRMAYMDAPINSPQPKYVTLAGNYLGKRFNSPNDAVFRSNGDLYFTDPPYGLEKNMDDPRKETPYQGVYKVNPQGQVTLLIDSISRPNGIGFLDGGHTLIIANSDGAKAAWYLFNIGSNDSLTSAGLLYDATEAGKKEKGGPDGLKVDKQGNIFATGPGGIWIFSKDRKLIGKIKVPPPCSNIALADDDKTLYITNDDKVLRLKLRN